MKKTAKKSNDVVKTLCATLKVDAETVKKIALCEKALMQAKSEKLSSKCKVIRQRARNLKFFRHEHTAETIAQVQSLAKTL